MERRPDKRFNSNWFLAPNQFFGMYVLSSFIASLTTFIMIILKLSNVIHLSWWFVTFPVWGLLCVCYIVLFIILTATSIHSKIQNRKKYITKEIVE